MCINEAQATEQQATQTGVIYVDSGFIFVIRKYGADSMGTKIFMRTFGEYFGYKSDAARTLDRLHEIGESSQSILFIFFFLIFGWECGVDW